MIRKYQVAKGYSYVDPKGRIVPQGTQLMLDDASAHVKSQMFKLMKVDEVQPEPTPVKKVETVKEAAKLVESLSNLVEPPKVQPKQDARKPGEGVEKKKPRPCWTE